MNVLSSLYGIIMDSAIYAPIHGNNVVYGINATDKIHLNWHTDIFGKIASNQTQNIGMLASASKDVSNILSYKCLHIHNNADRLNGLM